jgi:Co/Zn/Cd efflux system component
MTHPHGGHDHHHDHPKGLRGAVKEVCAPHSHDAADRIDGALKSSVAGIRAVKLSLLVLGATAIAQIVVVVMSGSIALAVDTIHNFSDALTAVPLWGCSRCAACGCAGSATAYTPMPNSTLTPR